MHIELAPDAPFILKAGATALLATHVGGGSLAIASGFVSVLARKGGLLHRRAGTVFFASMLAMTAGAAIAAPLLPKPQFGNGIGAVFTFYLVLTAWLTVRRRPGQSGRAEVALIVLPIAAVAVAALGALSGKPGDGGYAGLVLFSGVAGLAAAMDIRTIRRGGLIGPERTRRHLWRMCAALFVASGSFFLGQQRVMPEAWRGLPVWFIPALAPLVLLAFWMIRTRVKRLRPPRSAAAPA